MGDLTAKTQGGAGGSRAPPVALRASPADRSLPPSPPALPKEDARPQKHIGGRDTSTRRRGFDRKDARGRGRACGLRRSLCGLRPLTAPYRPRLPRCQKRMPAPKNISAADPPRIGGQSTPAQRLTHRESAADPLWGGGEPPRLSFGSFTSFGSFRSLPRQRRAVRRVRRTRPGVQGALHPAGGSGAAPPAPSPAPPFVPVVIVPTRRTLCSFVSPFVASVVSPWQSCRRQPTPKSVSICAICGLPRRPSSPARATPAPPLWPLCSL